MSLILQIFSIAGCRSGQEPNGFKEEKDSNEETKRETQVGSLLSLSIYLCKRKQVRLHCVSVSKALPFLSGIE